MLVQHRARATPPPETAALRRPPWRAARWFRPQTLSRVASLGLALSLVSILGACGSGDPATAGGGAAAASIGMQARAVPTDLLPPASVFSPLARTAEVSTLLDHCTTRWQIRLRTDGRLHVSKSAAHAHVGEGDGGPAPGGDTEGGAPGDPAGGPSGPETEGGVIGSVQQWVEPLRVSRFAVTHLDVTRPLLTLVDQTGTRIHRMSLEPSTCGPGPVAADPLPVLHHSLPGDQMVASLKVLSNSDRQTRAVLRTGSGAWLEDDGQPLGLAAEVIDFIGADPALQSAHIDNARLFALRVDGRVQRLPVGPGGPIEFVSGLSGVRQLSGDGFAVFARADGGQVHWVNPDEAGADPDPTAGGSLPTDPSALPVLLEVPSGGACAMADALLIACRSRSVLRIRSVVHGTRSQTGAFLVGVDPSPEDLGVGLARAVGSLAPLTLIGSPVTGARAAGVWIQTFDGRTLDGDGQPIAVPGP